MSLARQLLGIFIHGDHVAGWPTHGGLVPKHGSSNVNADPVQSGPIQGSPNLDPAGGTLTVVGTPSVVGDMVVGQRQFATHGTYSALPDSYAMQWFSDGVAMFGETADNYLILDTDATHTITYGEIAQKAGYLPSNLNMAP